MKYILIYTVITSNGVVTGNIIFPSYAVSEKIGEVYYVNECSKVLEDMKKSYNILGVRFFVGGCYVYSR